MERRKQNPIEIDMNNNEAISILENSIVNPMQGLPEEVFLFASRITPMVNVDLLIQDETGRTLLAWRNDGHTGCGWHVPGGIIRFKEKLETRIQKVAETEIGTNLEYNPEPIAVNQIILEQNTRGHFISFLYKCFLSKDFTPENKGLTNTDAGYLQWHNTCPDNLLEVQSIYRRFINGDK